jgi:hypothetical protein
MPPASAPADEPNRLSRILQSTSARYAARVPERPRAALSIALDPPRSSRALVESIALSALLPAVGWLVDRADPFLLGHSFPWIVFPPILAGLRHGFAPGCACAGLLGGGLVAAWRAHAFGVDAFPAGPALGLFTLAMLTGQFSDVWRRESAAVRARLDAAQRSGEELARAHFLLELSHERLEEQCAAAPNLRDALREIAAIAQESGDALGAIGDRLLSLFATYALVEVATLARVRGREEVGETVATLGSAGPVEPDDPLLVAALRSRTLAALDGRASVDARVRSRLVAAVPFVDVDDAVHAVLCVHAMPFVAYGRRNLTALAILAGHCADRMRAPRSPGDPRASRRAAFDARLARALRDRRDLDVPSLVAAYAFDRGGPAEAVIDVVLGASLRGIDAPFETRDALGNRVVFVVVPMADADAGRALRARAATILRRELDATLEEAGLGFAFTVLTPTDSTDAAMERIARLVRVDGA